MGKGIYFEVKQASVNTANFGEVIKFTIPAPSPVRIVDIAINPDSAFTGSGKFSIFVGGQTIGGTGSPLPTAIDIPVWSFKNKTKMPEGEIVEGLILNPGDTIEILASITSGSGLITAMVAGEIV